MSPLRLMRLLPPSRRFMVQAVVNFALNLGLTALLHEAGGLDETLAFAITLVAVTGFSFVMFRYVVFESTHRPWGRQLGEFVASVAGFRVVEAVAFWAVHEGLGVQYLLTATIVLTGSFFGKFLLYRLRVFAAPVKPGSP